MTTFYAECLDECGHDATLETEASSKDEARAFFEDMYPDMRIRKVQSHAELYEAVNARYARMEREYDEYD